MTRQFSAPHLVFAIGAFVLPGMAQAQEAPLTAHASPAAATAKAAPQFTSGQDAGRLRNSSFTTPESDGRPALYYFALGARAARRGDLSHAVAMYKVAASWAYKPAEYNLSVMYLRGQGPAVDLPRALAWMALAAERRDPQYVKALDLINRQLSDAQFKQANEIFAELLPTFGDKVALVRAKARWQQVLASATGSRVGSSATPLLVGAVDGDPNHMRSPYYLGSKIIVRTGFQAAGGHTMDGALAYQQMRASNNPYDAKFEWHPDATGTVRVGPLKPVRTKDARHVNTSADPATTETGHPF